MVDHIGKVLLFQLVKLPEGFCACDVQVVLGLRFGGFEGTGKNGDLGFFYLLGHLRMGEILINQDTINQLGILHTSTCFPLHLDKVEVNILSGKVSNTKDSLNSNLSQLLFILAHNLRPQTNHSSINKFSIVLIIKFDLLCNSVQMLESDLDGHIVPIGNFKWMES